MTVINQPKDIYKKIFVLYMYFSLKSITKFAMLTNLSILLKNHILLRIQLKHYVTLMTDCHSKQQQVCTVKLLWVELRLVDFLDVSKKNESPDFSPYIFLIKTYLCVEILCVEFFDVSRFFRGPCLVNLVQFTTNKSKLFDYFDTVDLETFFTPNLAAIRRFPINLCDRC
jgi:hypothetical protein